MHRRTQSSRLKAKFAFMTLACFALAGCNSGRPFELWETHVETYVSDYGNGDIMCLRTTDPEVARPVFGTEKGSTLVQGVLVGCEDTGSHTWWVYIVGASRDERVREVRVMAVAAGDEGLIFASSEGESDATKQYLDHRLGEWKNFRIGQSEDKDFQGLFPGHTDSFTLEMAGEVATVTEANSGARWSTVLSDGPQLARH